jgi:hypothetical protein
MTNQVLGVQEIRNNKIVDQMCNVSEYFKRVTQELYKIEEEIDKNNIDPFLCFSSQNKDLKIKKLKIKQTIMLHINSFQINFSKWIKTYGKKRQTEPCKKRDTGKFAVCR